MNDPTGETVAIGLDVQSLEGKDRSTIEALLVKLGCLLVGPDSPIPEDWPPEIRERRWEAEHGMFVLWWNFQLEDGEWANYYAYGEDAESELDAHSSLIYTRKAKATPGVTVRPIAELTFDKNSVCEIAAAHNVELVLSNRRDFIQFHG